MDTKKIADFVVVENYIADFMNNKIQNVIDSFTPFIGKKFTTNSGFVAKYKRPILTANISQELKEIGIQRLDCNLQFNTFISSITIYFNFNMYGNGSIFEKQYSNPYRDSNIKKYALQVILNDGILESINNVNKPLLLDATEVINNFQAACIKKKEYEAALNNVEGILRTFVK